MPEETANQIIRSALERYGLQGLLDDIELDLIGTWQSTPNMDAVWAKVQQSQSYRDRFPAMQSLADRGRAISEETYVAMEQQYASVMSMYGLPATFYDQAEDFSTFLENDVSVNELHQRVGLAAEASAQVTSEVREQLADYYNVTEEDLTAFYLDPERATSIFEERERFETARIGGIAAETGFGSIDRQTAERLRQTGVTAQEARRGFGELAGSTLGEETASEGGYKDPETGAPMVKSAVVGAGDPGDITSRELVEGAFGTDIESARRIEGRRQRRLAQFNKRGGPALTRGGYTGLGSAE